MARGVPSTREHLLKTCGESSRDSLACQHPESRKHLSTVTGTQQTLDKYLWKQGVIKPLSPRRALLTNA